MVQTGARVLDLGCGDGDLLEHLTKTKRVWGYGFDLDPDNIIKCLSRGVSVIQKNLDDGLGDFATDAFDVLIMANTLQAIHRPDALLKEMLRVGRTCIVTLPNFGHWTCRWQLLCSGQMPVSSNLPHQWYETPNIHLCTFRDFEALCKENNYSILERRVVASNYGTTRLSSSWPNLFAAFGLYRLEGAS